MKFALTELNKIVENARRDHRPGSTQMPAVEEGSTPSSTTTKFDGILQQHAIDALCRTDRRSQDHHHGRRRPASDVGRPVLQVHATRALGSPARGLGTMGFGLPAAMGAQAAHPDALVIDIDGDGSFQMNIQELATCFCEKLPVKVLLLNNQHLGMVVQWEDRFHDGNRAHTYLGPIDHAEATGKGDEPLRHRALSRLREDRQGLRLRRRHGQQEGRPRRRPRRNDRYPGPYRARRRKCPTQNTCCR